MSKHDMVSGPDGFRAEVSSVLGTELGPADDEVNLFELGLQSLQLMELTSRLNRAGLRADFTELASDPRLTAWYGLLTGDGRAPRPVPDGPAARHGSQDLNTAPFPLTPVQQAYWIGRGDDRPLGGVGCHAYLEFDPPRVDTDRLDTAVRALTRRHPMLRARFDADGTQRVLDEPAWPGLTVHDHSGQSPEAAERALLARRDTLSHRRLDVAAGEVMDVQLSRTPDGGCRLHVEVDLLVADVHSIRLILADLAALYEDPESLPAPRYDFPRYLADRDALRTADRARAEAYWTARLPGLPGGPALPLRTDPAEIDVPRFVRRTSELSPQEWAALRRRAGGHGITPSVLIATAFAEVLARWSGERHFLLNLPLFDRDHTLHPDIGAIVADFTSLVLLEVDLAPGTGFADRAAAVQKRLHDDVGHAAHTGVDVLREFARADGGTPRTAPVVLACNVDAPLVPDTFAERFGDLSWMVSQTPQVWLDCQVYRTRTGGLLLAWDAVEELFPDGVLDAMLSACAGLLRELVTADWGNTPDIPLPSAQRRRRDEVNSVPRRPSGRLLHEEFFARAGQRGDTPALVSDDGTVGHRELAARALRIAGALAGRGVGPGSQVVVGVSKGPDQTAAVLGVLAAGATYVPVGTDQPAARRDRILALSGARVVLADRGTRPGTDPDLEVLPLERALSAEPLPAPVPVAPDDTAYVIFTSGSTGTPKGVEISHRSAVNTVEDVNERFAVTATDRVLAVSALDFDLSVWDIFGPLAAGGALVLVTEAERRDAHRWLELCRRHRVTVWNSVPALMDMLLTAADRERLPASLRLALLSGDWIGLDLPDALREASAGRCRLIGLGGATEAAIWSNFHEVTHVPAHWRSIPYGTPLADQRFRVVDPQGRDCPDWVSGELWIGGAGVALGYRGDPELTAERFVRHQGARWYRTGDLGRYWPDGTLEFLGRLDHQVKINGFRVELGEIEAALHSHPAVADAVAVAVGDRRKDVMAAVVEHRTPRAAPEHVLPPRAPNAEVEREHELAESVLAAVLARSGLARAAGAGLPPVPGECRELLAAWVTYLMDRQVLAGSEQAPVPGPRWSAVRDAGGVEGCRERLRGTRLEAVAEAWERAVPLLVAVLAGEAAPTALLDEPALTPEGLADLLPGTRACLAGIAEHLAGLAAGRTPAVVEWAGGDGRNAARILRETGSDAVAYTLTDASAARLAAAKARLADRAHTVSTVVQDAAVVREARLHRFDAVVVNDVLALTPDVDAVAGTLALLARSGAPLFLVARDEPSPLSVPGGATLRHPSDAARWLGALARQGFTEPRVLRTEPDGTMLITARSPSGPRELTPDALRSWLARRLPAHMIPGTVAALPVLPLNGNGKVDRTLVGWLLSECADRPRQDAEPPRGETEELIAGLWAEVLGGPAPARAANFFLMGGDSLLATRLVAAVRRRCGVELPMRAVLRTPTVAGLAALVTELSAAQCARGPAGQHPTADELYEVGAL
ncbi:amino acid adenylation domain-containing protein [Streptomyces sp. NPDC050548]|uniref:amino acid adenylation domain-containing protein n=1 Tax=Streptomyces sp. NPDC050548 TaxID=3365629 RepID=UPI0037916892